MSPEQWSELPGRLFVLSGPSGVGKTTLADRLVARPELNLTRSVTATTRAPRAGEVDGVDYFFLSEEEFARRRDAGEFLEWAVVHGRLYGTPLASVERLLEQGRNVLLVIDVQGGMAVRDRVRSATLIFLAPPSREALEQRLRARGTEAEAEALRGRLWDAHEQETSLASKYDYLVVNDDLDRAEAELAQILSQSRHPEGG